MKDFIIACILTLVTCEVFAEPRCPSGQNINEWDTKDLLYPHVDCDKYYICVHGAAIERQCPRGLFFNTKTKQCDWPYKVRCTQKKPKATPTTAEKLPTASTVSTVLANKKCNIVQILGWKNDVLLPHWDCDKYYQCDNGVAVTRICPGETYFNVLTDECNHKENVKCYREDIVDVSVDAEELLVDGSFLSHILASKVCRVFDIFEMRRDIKFAHWECNKFYICDNGAAVARPCPAGLHFNTIIQKCDYPENVECRRQLRDKETASKTETINSDIKQDEQVDEAQTKTALSVLTNKKCHILQILGWKHDVLFPHWDCDKYYQCDNGVAVPRLCPDETYFNPITDVCDYPDNVKCYRETIVGGSVEAESLLVSGSSLTPVLANRVCRLIDIFGVRRDIMFAHWDCDKYYICDNGAAVARPCPAGLHFNTIIQKCDYPENVECRRQLRDKETASKTETINSDIKQDEQVDEAQTKTALSVLTNKKCHILQILGWKHDVLFPHWDCDKYYQCDNGVAVPRLCPDETYFNPITDVCDYPDNVKCYRETIVGGSVEAESLLVSGSSLTPVLANRVCRLIDIIGVRRDIMFAHWDCDKYYICDNGAAVARPCPAGLHFNTIIQKCDYPENVECRRQLRDKETASKTETINSDIKQDEQVDEAQTKTALSVLTNKKCHILQILGWKHDVLFPHWDCDKYYQCDNGVAVPRLCPDETYFNPITDVCDYPDNVKCYRETIVGGSVEAESLLVSGSSLTPVLANRVCRLIDIIGVRRDIMFAHWDCDKYYICDNGAAVARPCPAGLHFNTIIQKCDYPENVECRRQLRDKETASKTETINSDIKQDEQVDEAQTKTALSVLTNKKCHILQILGWKHDVLFPHWDCDKYYQCDNGVAVPRLCPDETYFNPITDVCDYPDNVKCYRETIVGGSVEAESLLVSGSSLTPVLANRVCRLIDIFGVRRDIMFAHWDCDKYYICDNGAAVARPCPATLHFNIIIQKCDYPQNFECKRKNVDENGCKKSIFDYLRNEEELGEDYASANEIPGSQSDTIEILNQFNADYGVKNDLGLEFLENGCPIEHVYWLLPHETDCNKFYYCNYGKRIERQCARTLFFNPSLQVCDFPENSGCINFATLHR